MNKYVPIHVHTSRNSIGDATLKLDEYISKAKELGLKNTNFVNPTGLDEENHYSTAYDMAIIAKELIKHEEIFKYILIFGYCFRRIYYAWL